MPEVINVIFPDLNPSVDVEVLLFPAQQISLEGVPGPTGPPGPALNPYLYFDDVTQTWPPRVDLTTVVWVGGDEAHPPTGATPKVDIWVRRTT